MPLSWRAHPVFTVGGRDEGLEAFHQVGHAVMGDTQGQLYVLDKGNHRVVIFDTLGLVVTVRGSRGGGPGELENPRALVVDANGTLTVFDSAKRGFVRWDAAGAFLDVVPARHSSGNERIALIGQRVIHVVSERFGGSGARIHKLLSYGSGVDSVVLASRVSPPGVTVAFSTCPLTFPNLPRFLEGEIRWHATGDRLLIQRDDAYRIEVWLRAELVKVIERPVDPFEVTQHLAEQAAAEEFGAEGFVVTYPNGRCVISPADMVAARGYAEHVSAVRRIRASPDGGLWVERLTTENEHPIDVFADSGEYIGTLPHGTPFPDAFLGVDRFAVVERDTLDIEIVTVYRIDR